jgi:CxxC motif-containing protein (DUF1111 family)
MRHGDRGGAAVTRARDPRASAGGWGPAAGGGRLVFVVVGLLWLAACAPPPEPGDPLPGLTGAERERFERGRAVFSRVFTPETGLGPLFNADSCAACHDRPVTGGSGDEIEVHATAFVPEALCDPLLNLGGPVYQQRVTPALERALGITAEPIPERATGRGLRTTPDVFGFGLIDAVPEAAILARADPDDRDGDGISGRPNRFIDGRLGRFGRKAFLPGLRQFNSGAFQIEQGITTPDVPDEGTVGGRPLPPGVDPVPDPEIGAAEVDLADDFVRFLAPPAPRGATIAAWLGRGVFGRLGCDACHVPHLRTGDHPVRALRHREFAAYTDLLLHDMGPDLADICLGEALPSEFRTEPLMGLRFSTVFLHDGRARSIDEAIRLHGGEAAPARDRFVALSERERRALLEFLAGL